MKKLFLLLILLLIFYAPTQAQKAGNPFDGGVASTAPRDYISGLELTWNSATSITVGTGAATIESTGAIYEVTSAITKSSLSLSASAWYYLYLYNNSGTADIDVSTTVPAIYFASASSKTGNTARRFVGAILTDGSGNVWKFRSQANGDEFTLDWIVIPYTGGYPFRVLSGGTATTPTDVSLTGVVPDVVYKRFRVELVTDSTVTVGVSAEFDSTPHVNSGEIYSAVAVAPVTTFAYLPVSEVKLIARSVKYMKASGGTGALYLDTRGFVARR